jgi:hypothetical protein
LRGAEIDGEAGRQEMKARRRTCLHGPKLILRFNRLDMCFSMLNDVQKAQLVVAEKR